MQPKICKNIITKLNLPKKQMIKEICTTAKSNGDFISAFELQIMSKAFVEHYYRGYVLKEDVGQFDMT